MRIVSWNCNGAFRRKYKELISYNCDILIIQECENPNLVKYTKEFELFMPNFIWVGDNKSKGLGVFSKYKLDDNLWDCGGTKYFISCRVNNEFDLLGLWCHHANSPTFGYIGQMWKYMKLNKEKIRGKDIIIGGDFNSNKIWDVWDRWWNHSDVFNELGDIDIKSLYHQHYNEEQGKESIPTLYHRKNIEKPYHVDYILASKRFCNSLSKFEIGNYKKWIKVSDHMPLFIDV
ncbi:MAG: endonuclease/exonuclease/phosphatase family protein [Tepidibacter sp.]|jgi:exonuclease III|uniref:endonuclease/exonuclease/phosphatase family protein n=1 Tax=Tepidibacter sp. TaxID=2529387 RepID=UPI0025D2513D|nr:endonuclease/exonuclease/phosphatase family protein [Tepidibacter sp.]MCT4509531.1 endonuclease/exonuclease/phosphatase family protein [Tepidibacter sp.]